MRWNPRVKSIARCQKREQTRAAKPTRPTTVNQTRSATAQQVFGAYSPLLSALLRRLIQPWRSRFEADDSPSPRRRQASNRVIAHCNLSSDGRRAVSATDFVGAAHRGLVTQRDRGLAAQSRAIQSASARRAKRAGSDIAWLLVRNRLITCRVQHSLR